MKYTMPSPCDQCPFLIGSGFSYQSLVAYASGQFACHKQCDVNEETDEYEPRGPQTQHCAGALIFLEFQNAPHQMMRICERLGLYDRRHLNMQAPVVRNRNDCKKPRR